MSQRLISTSSTVVQGAWMSRMPLDTAGRSIQSMRRLRMRVMRVPATFGANINYRAGKPRGPLERRRNAAHALQGPPDKVIDGRHNGTPNHERAALQLHGHGYCGGVWRCRCRNAGPAQSPRAESVGPSPFAPHHSPCTRPGYLKRIVPVVTPLASKIWNGPVTSGGCSNRS